MGVALDRLPILERTLARIGFIHLNDRNAYDMRLIRDHRAQRGVGNLGEILVVAAAEGEALLPPGIVADRDRAYVVLDAISYDAARDLVEQVPHLIVAPAQQLLLFLCLKVVVLEVFFALQFGILLVVKLVGGFRNPALHNARRQADIICQGYEVVQSQVNSYCPRFVQVQVLLGPLVDDFHRVIRPVRDDPDLLVLKDSRLEGRQVARFWEVDGVALYARILVGKNRHALASFRLVPRRVGTPEKLGRINFVLFQCRKIGTPVLEDEAEDLLVRLRREGFVEGGILEHELEVIIVDAFAKGEVKLPHVEIAKVVQVFGRVAQRRKFGRPMYLNLLGKFHNFLW